MDRWCCLIILLLTKVAAFGQFTKLDSIPRKGSYLYYLQPAFEDNSFLLEEAINQEKGIMQYISNFYFDNTKGGNFLYSFNQDIPITHLRHQVNYTVYYHIRPATPTREQSNGIGDVNIGYHYMLTGKKNPWAMVVPGITLILPTGKSALGQGAGGLGAQINLAVTKRISRKLITNYNLGYTYIAQADGYTSTITGAPVLTVEKDLQYSNLGFSVVWYPVRKVNLFAEYVSNFLTNISDDGTVTHTHQATVNPGFRFAIDHRSVQIVPGFSVPVIFTDGQFSRTGIFFYLSFETEYLPFTKSKGR